MFGKTSLPATIHTTPLDLMTLEQMFEAAQEYGLVHLHNSKDRTYSCNIEFYTIPNSTLSAHSGYYHKTPKEAVKAAVVKAMEIVNSIKAMR